MSVLQSISTPKASMFAEPNEKSEMLNELMFGENFQILEPYGQWYKAKALHDGYEGFIHQSAAKSLGHTSTHRVITPMTHIYEKPDFKSAIIEPAYFLAVMNIRKVETNGFLQIDDGRWIFAKHVTPIDQKLREHTEIALGFLGSPYVWGGRSYVGLDCSALVQLSLMACGINCPRDTKDQFKTLGKEVMRETLRRGDFVFFERHVGIMLDQDTALNATARHMKVVFEPLSTLESSYNGLQKIRRL